jgi:hypothetical protein
MTFPNHRRLLGVISGMIVWAIWFVIVYSLVGVGCDEGWNTIDVPGGNALSLAMLLSTAVALLLIWWSAVRGYQGWRRGVEERVPGQEAQQRMRFMGLTMLVLSVMAAIGTVMVAIPILMLEPCAL